ncbi:alpha/beta hydrolase [soil metagenome]
MPYTSPQSSEIYYETTGDPADRPLVLIEGLSAQLIGWREAFVDMLAARGFFVIRLDNRDIGLSHKTGSADVVDGGYSLRDMADDVFRALDALGLASAHIVGQSMGGAIAQQMAITRPDRVRSLVLFYTAPAFSPDFVGVGVLDNLPAETPPPMATREQVVEELMARARMSGAPGRPFDETFARDLVVRSLDRCERLDGIPRQIAALVRSGDWRSDLNDLSIPTAIIHGREDQLVKIDAAFELARRIADAELHLYPHMGHEIAPRLWEEYAAIIDTTAARATQAKMAA